MKSKTFDHSNHMLFSSTSLRCCLFLSILKNEISGEILAIYAVIKHIKPAVISDVHTDFRVIEEKQFIVLSGYCVTEHCSIIRSGRLHPETNGELTQTAHAPDVDIVADAFAWEVKSVI